MYAETPVESNRNNKVFETKEPRDMVFWVVLLRLWDNISFACMLSAGR